MNVADVTNASADVITHSGRTLRSYHANVSDCDVRNYGAKGSTDAVSMTIGTERRN